MAFFCIKKVVLQRSERVLMMKILVIILVCNIGICTGVHEKSWFKSYQICKPTIPTTTTKPTTTTTTTTTTAPSNTTTKTTTTTTRPTTTTKSPWDLTDGKCYIPSPPQPPPPPPPICMTNPNNPACTTTTTIRTTTKTPSTTSAPSTTSGPYKVDDDPLATSRVMNNREDLINGICDNFYRGSIPGKLKTDETFADIPANNQPFNLQAAWCSNAYTTTPTKAEVIFESIPFLKPHISELTPLKQRRTMEPLKAVNDSRVWCNSSGKGTHYSTNSWDGMGDLPPEALHIRCKHITEENVTEDHYPEWDGTIQPFALNGSFCSLENEAYIIGAILSSPGLTSSPEDEFGLPWRTLEKYWPRLVNLHAGGIDTMDSDHECIQSGTGITEANRVLLQDFYGDCIFNQRLAIEPSIYSENVDTGPRITVECSKSGVLADECCLDYLGPLYHNCSQAKQWMNKSATYVPTVDVPVVALGCAPYYFLYCGQEYQHDQLMDSKCECHPQYSVSNANYTDKENFTERNVPCFPTAGVPCGFDTSDEFSKILPGRLQCAPGMNCTALSGNQSENKWSTFRHSFTGFGMSPIARDYLVSRATHICECMDSTTIQTVFNECLPRDGGIMLASNFILVFVCFLLLPMFSFYYYTSI